jgi:iron complex outermembrane recepter protein
MKRLIITGIVLLSLTQVIYTGTTTMAWGRVTDASTGKPILGAQVCIFDVDITVGTDSKGRYWIHNVPDGYHSVVILKEGYKYYKNDKVPITEDPSHGNNFVLEPYKK